MPRSVGPTYIQIFLPLQKVADLVARPGLWAGDGILMPSNDAEGPGSAMVCLQEKQAELLLCTDVLE
jgi:hypothetical protein